MEDLEELVKKACESDQNYIEYCSKICMAIGKETNE